MKKIIMGLLLLCPFVSAFSQTAFTLSGSITGAPDAWVRLTYTNSEGKRVADSCSLRNGAFSFKGDISTPQFTSLIAYKGSSKKLQYDKLNNKGFYLEPGNITANGSVGHLNELKINGSKLNDEYVAFEALFDDWRKQSDPIEDNYLRVHDEYNLAAKQKKPDSVLDSLNKITQSIDKQLDPFTDIYNKIDIKYINSHPDSYISVSELNDYKSRWKLSTVKNAYNSLSPAMQNSSYGKTVHDFILLKESSSANAMAKNFTTTDINGKAISLSDFKGKYVLLDFWASWCVPCRESTPHVMELYKKYNAAGLDVIAIADDDNMLADWKKAIKKDKMEIWHNVLRGLKETPGGGFDTSHSISDQFAVSSIPTKILVDRNGMIVGRYGDTDSAAMLDKKLAEIFK